jgi:hypothetical protein
MKKKIFASILSSLICVSLYCADKYLEFNFVYGVNYAGKLNGLNIYVLPTESDSLMLYYYNTNYTIPSWELSWNTYINNQKIGTTVFKNISQEDTKRYRQISVNKIKDKLSDKELAHVKFHYFNTSDYYISFYMIKESKAQDISCTGKPYILCIAANYPQRVERSSDNGLQWEIISTNFSYLYTETNPIKGTYLYRVLNADGTYSNIKQITYQDAVPDISILSDNPNKTVDDSISFRVSSTHPTYTYQWYKNGSIISNATDTVFYLPKIKSADVANYTCVVSNGCNSVISSTATLSVEKSQQLIEFPDIPAKIYGDAAFALPEKTDKGLIINYQSTNTSVATVSGNIVTIVSPGSTNIIASQAGSNDYLEAASITRTLTINKITQLISIPETATKTYGDLAYTIPDKTDKGFIITYTSTNTNVATVSGNTVTINNAGTTEIVASQTGNSFYYAAPTVTQTLTVNKAEQTITFNQIQSKTFGDAAFNLTAQSNKGLTITYTSSNPDVVSISGSLLTINKAGTATITASQAGNANHHPATSVARSITINKASQAIELTNIPNKTFGDTDFTLPQQSNKGLTITYQSADTTIARINGNSVKIKGAGTVNITASQIGNDNYLPAVDVTLPLSISKAVQTITFPPFPQYNYGISKLKLNASSNSGLKVNYESSDYSVATVTDDTLFIHNAGQCYITASVSGNANYFTGTPVQQQLVVNKAAQVIQFEEINNKTYGDTQFSLTAFSDKGLPVVFTSSEPSKLLISGNTATILGAGTFTITSSQAGNDKYNSASTTRTFTVNKAQLIATAESKTKVYGEPIPTLTVAYSGFVNGDTRHELASQPNASTSATSLSEVADYAITLSTITDPNYSLTYRNGLLSVTPATLIVTSDNKTKIYGDPNPILELIYSGFKNTDTSSSLTATPSATTTAKTMSNVGEYNIIISGGLSKNYTFNYTNAKLTINKAPLKAYANNQSRKYGDSNPNFDVIYDGFKGDDNVSILSNIPTTHCNAINASVVGDYEINISGGLAQNYEFDYNTKIGKLTVTKAPLLISVNNASKQYGEPNPNFTLSYEGFRNGENYTALTSLPVAESTALLMSNTGEYDINISGGEALNYEFTLSKGKLNITKASLGVIVNSVSREYGDQNPSTSLSFSGFKGADDKTVLDQLPLTNISATILAIPGIYDIAINGGIDNNYAYDFSGEQGKLNIEKAPLQVKVLNDSIKMGMPIPEFKFEFSGFKNGENEAILNELPTIHCEASTESQAGIYDVTLSGGNDIRYEYLFTNGILIIKDPTGLGKVSVHSAIYPNPVIDVLNIAALTNLSRVDIYLINGTKIYSNETGNLRQINVSGLESGVYLLKTFNETGESSTSLFIKK